MAGYDAGKKEIIYHPRLSLGSQNLSHQRWLMRGLKHPLQLFCQTMTWKTVTTDMKSDVFISTFQIKRTSWSQKSTMGESKYSKISITAIATANAMGNKLPMFVIGKAKNPRCFKYVKFLPCRYSNQRKSWMDGKLFEGWSQKATQDVCIWMKKCCFCDRQLPCPSSYWQPQSNQVVFPTT